MSLRERFIGPGKAAAVGAGKSADLSRRPELRDAWAAFDASGFANAIIAVRPYLGVADSKPSREARTLVALA